jgi:hypothetical protein
MVFDATFNNISVIAMPSFIFCVEEMLVDPLEQ